LALSTLAVKHGSGAIKGNAEEWASELGKELQARRQAEIDDAHMIALHAPPC
jgi:hypothetical protein